jgi:hypothetical protein
MVDTAELRKLAEAATPGPWVCDGDNVYHERLDEPGRHLANAYVSYRQDAVIEANAAYIAAVSPDVLLALLDRLEAPADRVEKLEAALSALERCEHDGGFDREMGPIGCLLGDKCVCAGIYPILSAALTAAGAPAEVAVKNLEWHKSHMTPWEDDWHTISPLIYTVRCADENGWRWSCSGAGAHGYARSADGAKAGAQEHFNSTIRAAILTERASK